MFIPNDFLCIFVKETTNKRQNCKQKYEMACRLSNLVPEIFKAYYLVHGT